jgi:alkane 1-monooxygenase
VRESKKAPFVAATTKTLFAGLAVPSLALRLPWWSGFGLSLVFPLAILGFLATGPHGLWGVVAWTLPMWVLVALDYFSPPEIRPVPAEAPRGFFDGILYLLALLQVLNVLALGGMVARLGWASPLDIGLSLLHLAAVRLMVGANFCCAAICPAHELIHRRNPWQRRLGRLLLMTLCYDHFAVSHQRAHHARLGSAEDPSTARLGESFEDFFRRTCAVQWHTAWRTDRRSMLTGVVIQAVWLGVYLGVFGPLALVMLLRESWAAVRTLEAVNYFEHYGLTQDSGRAELTAWRNDSAVSLFLFLGLTRHADHHRRPAAPYPALRVAEDGPVMPYGYLGMAVWVQRRNEGYRKWAGERLAGLETARTG